MIGISVQTELSISPVTYTQMIAHTDVFPDSGLE